MEEVNSVEEAVAKIVDKWASASPPPFLDLAIVLAAGVSSPSSDRLESLVYEVAAKRQPPVRFRSLNIALKGFPAGKISFTVFALKQT